MVGLKVKRFMLDLWDLACGLAFNLFIWVDQGFNVLLLGSADETLSSRAWRAYAKDRIFGKIMCPLIDFIFFWQSSHCYEAYKSEVERKQLPREFR